MVAWLLVKVRNKKSDSPSPLPDQTISTCYFGFVLSSPGMSMVGRRQGKGMYRLLFFGFLCNFTSRTTIRSMYMYNTDSYRLFEPFVRIYTFAEYVPVNPQSNNEQGVHILSSKTVIECI